MYTCVTIPLAVRPTLLRQMDMVSATSHTHQGARGRGGAGTSKSAQELTQRDRKTVLHPALPEAQTQVLWILIPTLYHWATSAFITLPHALYVLRKFPDKKPPHNSSSFSARSVFTFCTPWDQGILRIVLTFFMSQICVSQQQGCCSFLFASTLSFFVFCLMNAFLITLAFSLELRHWVLGP